MSLYEFIVKDASGIDVSMKEYEGKVLLIVNTATGCGLTPQYEGLQNLYDKYQDQGFEILDFPCNQFANQAPGTDDEIKSFCETRFGVTFKIFHKIDVNGDNADPLFTYLKKEQGGMLGSNIKWNFTKFLINQKGEVIKRFAPTDVPENLENDIKNLLSE
ncbi:glutathione peroxidase [uncultured Acetobacterium sp.]|uniref:glutathione peroxidase n=1 Tax=uncultured Acetobacterium sp. TaxID=217139 RepID=UPI002424F793|nr:glutathione peroxidase [uncultured Acetobacterium sp.]MBU4539872.1 glutathione peroxidase [Bacillota bacterium]